MSSGRAQITASGETAPEHAARYEKLRAQAVEGRATASRDGLVVLLRQGLAAWMEAWCRLPAPPSRPEHAECQRSSFLPDDASADVVRVLAAMTLGHIPEVHA